MLGFLFNLGMRAVTCKLSLRSALVGASKGAGIVFGFVANSVSRWGPKFFLNLWAVFFQLNLLLARTAPNVSASFHISLGLTLLMIVGAVIHATFCSLPSTTLSWVYGWLANRVKFLVAYLGILASFGYFFGPSFLTSLIHFRTFSGEVAKNLVETGGLNGIFPYGDLELGFIDVAGVYTLFQGVFISSSGLALLLQNSMFISLAFIIVFPFCLGTGVFVEGVLMSVGFPLFHVPPSLPKDLPSIVKDLDKKLVVKHPNLEKLFTRQPKSFFPYMFKGPDSTRFTITPPHDGFVSAHEVAARKVRGFLLNQKSVNWADFLKGTELFIKRMELSGHRFNPLESIVFYELVTQVTVHGSLIDVRTGYPCFELSPQHRVSLLLKDPAFRDQPTNFLSSSRTIISAGREVAGISQVYIETGDFCHRPELVKKGDFLYPDGNSLELKSSSGGVSGTCASRTGIFAEGVSLISRDNVFAMDTGKVNYEFDEQSFKPNIVTEELRVAFTDLQKQYNSTQPSGLKKIYACPSEKCIKCYIDI